MNNLANSRNGAAYPSVTHVIADPVSGNLQSISLPIADVLALCDGGRSVQQIAHELSNKYDATRLKIEEDCIAFLRSLNEEFVIF